MKLRLSLLTLSLALVASLPAFAQAPAGATGQCKDGSYWTKPTKSGACRGHKGIQTWYGAATAPKPSATVKSTPMEAPAPKPSPAVVAKIPPAHTPPHPEAVTAPGGGPGMVWVNTSTRVYHCPSDRYYGKTKDGKYMTESQAKAMGAKGARGKGCS
jgi:hypothetical protein